MSNDRIKIPKNSYTASLLTYLNIDQLSYVNQFIFVDQVPNIWENERSILFTSYLKQKVKDKFRDSNRVIQEIRTGDKTDFAFLNKRNEVTSNLSKLEGDNYNTNPENKSSVRVSFDDNNTTLYTSQTPKSHSSSTLKLDNQRLAVEESQPRTKLFTDQEFKKQHSHFTKKFKKLAKNSKGLVKAGGDGFREKVLSSILKAYEIGEIVQMSKVLLLVKKNEEEENRVYERWNEIFVVLRKTDSIEEPIEIQFYDAEKDIGSSSPKVNFKLNCKSKVGIYNYLDKTVYLKHESFKYILRFRNAKNALSWLLFAKQSLNYELDYSFKIFIPDKRIHVEIILPNLLLQNCFAKILSSMDLKTRDYGYEVGVDEIYQYLKNEIFKKFKIYHGYFFCFKDYDRLEWVENSGKLFLTQNLLSNEKIKLEYRKLNFDELFNKPLGVEGFLSRLTNTSGKEKHGLTKFYKLSYFYTNQDLLFYTKYYRVSSLPDTKNYYKLDSNGHIDWLQNDFKRIDNLCFEQSIRKTKLIIKAEGVLDMTKIVDVRVVPYEELTQAQKVLFCTLWYAKVKDDDEEIMNNCFEIEMENGSTIKLQAPNQKLRDFWVNQLIELSHYWKRRREEDFLDQLEIRFHNMRSIKCSKYIDSNATKETNSLEMNLVASNANYRRPPSLINISVLLSGFLYQKSKKHSNFELYFCVLCPGFLIAYHNFRRSRNTGTWKKSNFFEHYVTIPLNECYIYSGELSKLDLIDSNEVQGGLRQLTSQNLPRVQTNGWRSLEEDDELCFTLWFGKKRNISHYHGKQTERENNPGMIKMISKLGVTGKSLIFMCQKRQDRDSWVRNILLEMDKFN